LFIAGDDDSDGYENSMDYTAATTAVDAAAAAAGDVGDPSQRRQRRLHEIPHTCTHFGDASNHSFALGSHWVVCTAADGRFHSDRAVSRCQFEIRVNGSFSLCVFHLVCFEFINNRTLKRRK
jgi:hypothetical protein